MKKVLAVLLLVCLLLPTVVAAAPDICDFAYESGQFADWFICLIFAFLWEQYPGDGFGNGTVW